MSVIKLEEQIVSLDKILLKKFQEITFKDIISLIFHAFQKLSNNDNEIKDIHNNFLSELNEQNKLGWPKMEITKNDYDRRMDIIGGNSYIVTKNILTLLLRILYIENYKRRYTFKSYNYRKILSHKIRSVVTGPIEELSIDEILNILKHHLQHYMKIYYEESNFEYQLSNTILKHLE